MKKTGFTLMELLTVIAIIIILVGLLFPAFGRARQQAKENKAKAMIGSLEVAINMYFTDIGSYPASGAANLGLLIKDANYPNFGPYMDNKDYDAGGFKDPWWTDKDKRYYQYQLGGNPPANVGKVQAPPGKPFYLWSTGPETGNEKKDDDVVNW